MPLRFLPLLEWSWPVSVVFRVVYKLEEPAAVGFGLSLATLGVVAWLHSSVAFRKSKTG